jgi:hypothetical protein
VEYILLVTWFAMGQPPDSYQTIFKSAALCEAAQVSLRVDQARLQAEWQKKFDSYDIAPDFVVHNPAPTVTAVCAQR